VLGTGKLLLKVASAQDSHLLVFNRRYSVEPLYIFLPLSSTPAQGFIFGSSRIKSLMCFTFSFHVIFLLLAWRITDWNLQPTFVVSLSFNCL